MPPTDARPAATRPSLRKTPPQGLRLRRFKRMAAVVRLSATPAPRPLALRRPVDR